MITFNKPPESQKCLHAHTIIGLDCQLILLKNNYDLYLMKTNKLQGQTCCSVIKHNLCMIMHAKTITGIQLASKMALIQKWIWILNRYIFQHVWRFFLQALPEKLPPVVRNACPGCCMPPLYEGKVTAHLRDSHSSQQCYRTDICAQTSPLGCEERNIQ